MNVVVCIKQVADVEGRIVVERGQVLIQGLIPSYVINPLDLLAIEAAIRLKEGYGEGRVTLVSMGDASAEEALRRGIALGADDALLLSDPAFEGSDSYATALVLARTISTIPYHLVLCGQRADDTQAGQVGAYLAEILGIPLVQGVVKIETTPDPNKLRLQRKLERGARQVVECPLPAVLTVGAGLNTPRHATIKGVLKARRQEIPHRDARVLGISTEEVGVSGSKVRISHISPPKPKMKGLFVPDSRLSPVDKLKAIMGGGLVQKKSNYLEGDPKEVASQLIRFLKQQKFVPD